MPDDRFLSAVEVAWYLGRNPSRIYRWKRQGCPYHRVLIGGVEVDRFRYREVKAWMDQRLPTTQICCGAVRCDKCGRFGKVDRWDFDGPQICKKCSEADKIV